MLKMPQAVHDAVIAHCRTHYPKEACGILAAAKTSKDHQAVQAYPMRNVEDSPIGYSMDPNEQLAVEKTMRQRGQRMVGIYHSHTASAAYPSSVDVSLAISPDLSYVLVSLQHRDAPQIKSYRIDGTTITEEPLRVGGG